MKGADGGDRRFVHAFIERFGRAPTHAAQAPGRVNLIGEHVDYTGGWVLPMAIDRRTIVAAAPAGGATSRIASTAFAETVPATVGRGPIQRSHTFADRVLGVAAGFQRRGCVLPELDILIDSDVPIGAGLSSSAALEVAAATLFESMATATGGAAATAAALTVREKALLCQRAEHEFAGVPAGIMDMFVSIAAEAGHAVLLDCRSLAFELAPLPVDLAVLVVDTGVSHDLADGEYARRRRDCEDAAEILGVATLRDADAAMIVQARDDGRLSNTLAHRAEHVVGENRRTLEFAAVLRDGDPAARLGRILFESHASLRDRFEVSCPELDFVVDTAAGLAADGVDGARMTGGGFGGSAIVLCRSSSAGAVGRAIADRFRGRFAREADVFEATPAAGAGVLL